MRKRLSELREFLEVEFSLAFVHIVSHRFGMGVRVFRIREPLQIVTLDSVGIEQYFERYLPVRCFYDRCVIIDAANGIEYFHLSFARYEIAFVQYDEVRVFELSKRRAAFAHERVSNVCRIDDANDRIEFHAVAQALHEKGLCDRKWFRHAACFDYDMVNFLSALE